MTNTLLLPPPVVEPREGWYVATDSNSIRRIVYHGWMVPKPGASALLSWLVSPFEGGWEALPSGWTLGPRLDDLLRDAARYHWLEAAIISIEVPKWHWIGPSRADPLGPLIDAEIAREAGK